MSTARFSNFHSAHAEDERVWAVKELLFSYVRSPSLRHIRDAHSVSELAAQIVKKLDRKWVDARKDKAWAAELLALASVT